MKECTVIFCLYSLPQAKCLLRSPWCLVCTCLYDNKERFITFKYFYVYLFFRMQCTNMSATRKKVSIYIYVDKRRTELNSVSVYFIYEKVGTLELCANY
jgi:hypothetical protein